MVVHVSRLAAEKNYPLLFRAYEAIRAEVPNSRFVVVGDGPLRARLSRRYPYAHFTGFLPREEMAAHYASADLFVYASMTETFGNVVTEAMASGLPVVAYDYAAPARYIHHLENGYVVPLGDANRLVEGAVKLARNADLRLRCGAAARQTALGISWDHVIDGFERDLHAVVTSEDGALAASAC